MEEWTSNSNLIGKPSGSKPPLPPATWMFKRVNFGVHSIDQWMDRWHEEEECPIIIAYLTHLPTSTSFEMTLKYSKSEWLEILKQIDSKVECVNE